MAIPILKTTEIDDLILKEDLVNPSDYESIDIDAESGRLYIHVWGVKPKLWNYFENERGVEGEED